MLDFDDKAILLSSYKSLYQIEGALKKHIDRKSLWDKKSLFGYKNGATLNQNKSNNPLIKCNF